MQLVIIVLATLFLAVQALADTPADTPAMPDLDGYTEIFRDDFDVLNSDIWTHEIGNNNGWGNGESQYYTDSPKNSFCDDGVLTVRLIREASPDGLNDWTSARIITADTFNYNYGLVQAKARVSGVVDGPFPAIWSLSKLIFNGTLVWPAGGEIDLFEMQTVWDYIPSTLHFPAHHAGNALSFHDHDIDATEWHIYSMEWTPTYIRLFHDDVEIGRYDRPEDANDDSWPYKDGNPFYLLINNAMQPKPWGSGPQDELMQHDLEVDWIKVSGKEEHIQTETVE